MKERKKNGLAQCFIVIPMTLRQILEIIRVFESREEAFSEVIIVK